MILLYLIGIAFGISLVVVGYAKNQIGKSFPSFFVYMGSAIIFIIGLMVMIHGFPYVVSQTGVNSTGANTTIMTYTYSYSYDQSYPVNTWGIVFCLIGVISFLLRGINDIQEVFG